MKLVVNMIMGRSEQLLIVFGTFTTIKFTINSSNIFQF